MDFQLSLLHIFDGEEAEDWPAVIVNDLGLIRRAEIEVGLMEVDSPVVGWRNGLGRWGAAEAVVAGARTIAFAGVFSSG